MEIKLNYGIKADYTPKSIDVWEAAKPSPLSPNILFAEISGTVCDHFNVDISDFMANLKNREPKWVRLRLFVAKLMHIKGCFLKDIAKQLGKRDHSTIIHSLRTCANDYQFIKDFRQDFDSVAKRVLQ